MELLARIMIESGVSSLDREFFYKIPDELAGKIDVGHMVSVPFGHGKKNGLVIGFTNEKTDYELKDIYSLKSGNPIISSKEIELAFYMQKMYIASFFDCVRLLCPPGFFAKSDKKIVLLPFDESTKLSKTEESIIAFLSEQGGEAKLSEMKNEFGAAVLQCIRTLEKKKIISTKNFEIKKVSVLKRKFITLKMPKAEAEKLLPLRATAQRAALCALSQGDVALTDCEKAGFTEDAARALVKKNIAEIYDAEKRRDPFKEKEIKKTTNLNPTDEQKAALDKINGLLDEENAETVLLHGVTGSGKTEVFMQAIERVLKGGKSAIVLVPEISLTPQMTDRFLGRFGDKVAILHSMLSLGERLDEWTRIKNGEARVVVGARSAVFAPLSDIGIIIVDEEHENTYRSEQSPRYDALEVAKKRCAQYGALLILASATPSVADYYKAEQGEYHLIKMTKRYNEVCLPDVYVADMRAELKNGNRNMLSVKLRDEIAKNLKNKEQTVLFLNRRGFSTFVSCRDCGHVAMCPSCSIALTYHKNTQSLNCHYCGYKASVITVCPKCSSRHVKFFGTGTEKLEEEIKRTFTDCSVIRMDVDTASGKNAHEKILKKFSEEGIDILLGTQMVAKGLDFPNISLVGVVAADMSLNVDDYRASERTFDLITQVCGRAGRGNVRGRAVIQTYSPDHPVIEFAARQDYDGFYKSEIAFRKMFAYPPFSDIVSVSFSSEIEAAAKKACIETEQKFREFINNTDIKLYKSAPSPLLKIKGRYRWRFWFKGIADEKMREMLGVLYAEFKDKNVRMTVTVDPINMT